VREGEKETGWIVRKKQRKREKRTHGAREKDRVRRLCLRARERDTDNRVNIETGERVRERRKVRKRNRTGKEEG
jgi:hypothetical protein